MNVEAYIASGILEDYVLGLASDQERQEVECLSSIYPEVRTALQEAQEAMEQVAMVNQKAPPADLKDKIWASLENVEEEEDAIPVIIPPQTGSSSPAEKAAPPLTKPKTATLILVQSVAAAALILLGISIVYTISLKDQLEEQAQQLASFKQENQQTQADIAALNNQLRDQSNKLAVFQDPANTQVLLKGVDAKSADYLAMIYWNHTSKAVYVQTANLPPTPADKQYQLWAIVDGSPVDIGVIDPNFSSTTLQKMKAVEGAQAFAITLEKAGGSPVPTLAEMYVLGNS